MNRLMFAVACAGLAAAVAHGTETELKWKSATGGDISDVANWSGVPEGVTDISYDASTGYFGVFSGFGAKTLNLTLSKDFWFNRYYFQSAGTVHDFDLRGHTLKWRGDKTSQVYVNDNQHNQKITFRNGALDFYTAARRELVVPSEGSVLTFLGTDEEPLSIFGSAFVPRPSKGGKIVFTNTVARACQIKMSDGVGTIVLTGPKTEICHYLNDYAGVGVTGGGGATLMLENGATYDVINSSGSQKADILVGGTGSGGNTFIVAGEGSYLCSTNRGASDPGVASLVVGYQTNSNRLHVTDHASVKLSSKLLVGNPISDTTRGSASWNFIRIDSNAVVTAADIIIGQRANRDNYAYTQPMPSFVSNVCVIADGARVSLNQDGIKVGTEFTVSDSAVRITNKAYVSMCKSYVGTAGVSNRLDVMDGGVLYGKEQGTAWGLFVGGTASTGTVVSVDGGILALTNDILRMSGSAPGHETRLLLRNGGDVFVRYLETMNAGNRIEIDDSTLTINTEGEFPCGGDGTVTLAFSGSNPKLVYKNVHVGGSTEKFSFGTGVHFAFKPPQGGFASAPVCSKGRDITITGTPTMSIDETEFVKEGGGTTVLFDAGAGKQVAISDEALASFRASLGENGSRLRLSADKQTLSYRHKTDGLMILLR